MIDLDRFDPPLSEDDVARITADVERFNGEYPDAVRLIAQQLSGFPAAEHAEIIAIEPAGVTLRVETAGHPEASTHIRFTDEPSGVESLRSALYGLIDRARRTAGDGAPLTRLEREIEATSHLLTYSTQVAAVRDIGPQLRQITFRGGLSSFRPAGPDQFLLVTPRPDIDRESAPIRAYYTIRRWRPETHEIDMWFVLHGHGSSVSAWAATAEPGDPVEMWGPRTSYDPPPDTTGLLIAADETGLAATAAILEARARDIPARVVIEVTDSEHTIDLPLNHGDEVRWLCRGRDEPGTGSRFVQAIAHMDLDPVGLYAYGAAESRQIIAVRKHLRQSLGMPHDRVRMTGYWRRRASG